MQIAEVAEGFLAQFAVLALTPEVGAEALVRGHPPMLAALGQNLQSQNLKAECLQPRSFRVRYGR